VLTLTAVLRGSARYDRHGIVRLPLTALTGLGMQEGGIVVLRGARTTAAHVVLAPPDSPPGSVLCDEAMREIVGDDAHRWSFAGGRRLKGINGEPKLWRARPEPVTD